MERKARFIDSDLWKRLIEKEDSPSFSAQQEAAARLTEADVCDLLKLLDAESLKEQFSALGLLLMAIRAHNESAKPVVDDLRQKAANLAKNWTIEDPPLPSDKAAVMRWSLARLSNKRPPDIAGRAYALLAAMDRESAAQFLISHFNYEALSVYGREQVLHEFAELCSGDQSKNSKTAMERLIDIAKEGGPQAKKAVQYLIGRQLLRRSEVEMITRTWRATPAHELSPSGVREFVTQHAQFADRENELLKQANEWLNTRSIAALNNLYNNFLSTLPEGSAVGPLLALLGPPNWWETHRHVYNFSSDEGPTLQISLTSEGKVAALKLK